MHGVVEGEEEQHKQRLAEPQYVPPFNDERRHQPGCCRGKERMSTFSCQELAGLAHFISFARESHVIGR